MEPELVLDAHLDLGEGPIWDDRRQRLLFVDIMRGHVHEFDPASGRDRILDVGQPVGAVALAERGDWIIAAQRGFYRLDPESAQTSFLADYDADHATVRMNDGYVDARGRFWAGTMALDHGTGKGRLFRLDPDGTVTAMLGPVTISNGIDWSVDGTRMYYIDTRTDRVDVFDFDEVAGAIANRRVFAAVPGGASGHPDGLIVDATGAVWVALWNGAALQRYLPDGQLDRIVHFPASCITKCAFGGPDLADLYVTSAGGSLTPEQRAREPHAGGLFRVRPGVRGRRPHRFAG
jgi:sugar lactone lactonase YvrE